jgi:hypothetical protein
MRSAPCCEASRAVHAPVIVPAGAAAVQQQSLVAQAAEAAGIVASPVDTEGQRRCRPGMTIVRQAI